MLIKLLGLYKSIISPLLARSCRFYPSCSGYACEAIEHHGVLRAFPMIVWRILRCNPFSRGGYDPVIKRGTSYE